MDFMGPARRHKFILGFGFILIVKLVLAGLFSSDYQDALFMPFVYGWIKTGGNPYELFAQKQMFPYPPLMLFIESAGGLLSLCVGKNSFLASAVFKIPLLAFDILCFVFLALMFPNKKRQITVIYFLSPILLYSTYMHGQLDIIPTALLSGAIYFLLSNHNQKILLSSLFLTTALCTKFHILAIMPVFFIFVAKRHGLKKAIVYNFLIPVLFVFVVIVPFWSDGFVQNVLFNKEQSALMWMSVGFGSLKLYVPILVVLIVYLRMLVVIRINKDLFFGFSAILFTALILFVSVAPARYLWILPFFVAFYIDIRSNRKVNFLIFSLLNFMYLLYFVFAHDSVFTDLSFCGKSLDYIKTQNPIVKNICFTALFAVHVYIIYYIYCIALKGNALYKRQSASFIVGISGDSGSGKSTLVGILKSFFGSDKILVLECDGDHKWGRSDKNWMNYTHLNPLANYLYRQANDIAQLRIGKSVFRTEYNHETGRFDGPHKVLPKPYILVTGLHALYLPQLRQLEDLKIYMDIDEGLRRFWKIRRDVYERGHDLQGVLRQIKSRMADFHKYIEPQKSQADLQIRYYDKKLTGSEPEDYNLRLSLKITAVNEVNFEPLVAELSKCGISVLYEFNENMANQSLVFECADFEKSSIPVISVARTVVPELECILPQPKEIRNNLWSIIGLVCLIMINEKMNSLYGKYE